MPIKQIFFILALNISISALAQNASLYGRVTAEENQPVSLISVTLLNTRWGTLTNENGEYRIQNIKPGNYTLQLSYTGDIRKTQPV